jgi:DNA-directed RNA polymerase subunit beta
MLQPTNGSDRERVNFSKIKTSIQIPNLIEVQKRSYERWLQMYIAPADREELGLQGVFRSVFPISDFRGTCSLEFVEYSIGNWQCKCGHLEGLENLRCVCKRCGKKFINRSPKRSRIPCPDCGTRLDNEVVRCDMCGDPVALKLKYDVNECQERGMTYTVPLKVKIRLIVYDKDTDETEPRIRDIKEQEVYFGEIPLLTENGTFIVNGTERVIVSQLHRSPGVFFQSDNTHTVHMAKIIPYRGAWVEQEYDQKNLLYVRIDRKRKFYGTVFLRSLGLETDEQILRHFYQAEKIRLDPKKIFWKLSPGLIGHKAKADITDPKGKEVLVGRGKKIRKHTYAQLAKANVKEIQIDATELETACAIADVVDSDSGEIMLEANNPVTATVLEEIAGRKITKIEVFFPEDDDCGPVLTETLRKDPIKTVEEALIEIYRRLRPGDPPTLEGSRALFAGLFKDANRYDFSRVGRLKFNTKLETNVPTWATAASARSANCSRISSASAWSGWSAPSRRR